MKRLELKEGDKVSIDSVKLPKGEFVQLQPRRGDWTDLKPEIREIMYGVCFG